MPTVSETWETQAKVSGYWEMITVAPEERPTKKPTSTLMIWAALPPTAMTAADPHEASDVPHAAPAADATAPQAATEDSGPTPPQGPIVIRGRERSPLDEPVETCLD